MPLNTQIVRDEKNYKPEGGWQPFHACAMLVAVMFETEYQGMAPNEDVNYPDEPQFISPRNIFEFMNYPVIAEAVPGGEYVVTQRHQFVGLNMGEGEHIDGQIKIEFKPGDKLIFFRSHRD
jgi:hypothetical protein